MIAGFPTICMVIAGPKSRMSRYADSDIECAIQTVASLIDRFGDAYWPILDLLEDELARRRT